MFWIAFHAVAYLVAALWLVQEGFVLVQTRRQELSKRDHQARMMRISALELSNGVGLNWYKDEILAKSPIPGWAIESTSLIREMNGFVKVKCFCCDQRYRPADAYDWFFSADVSREAKMLAMRFCGDCSGGQIYTPPPPPKRKRPHPYDEIVHKVRKSYNPY